MKMIRQKFTRFYASNRMFLLLLIISTVLFSSIFLIRFEYYGNKSLFSDDSYFNLRLSKMIIESGKIPEYDSLSYGGRPFAYYTGWPITLVVFSKAFRVSIETASIILPVLLGILTLLMLGLTIKKFTKDNNIRNLSLLILALSPPFLYLFSSSNAFAGIVFLSVLSFYLMTFDKIIHWLIAIVLLSLISYFNIFATVFLSMLFLIYILAILRRKIPYFFMYLLLVLIINILHFYRLITNYGFPDRVNFNLIQNAVNFNYQTLFSDLGGKFGLSIFSAILLFLGIYVLWTYKKYKFIIVYSTIFLLTVISVYFNFIIFYLNILIAIIGSLGLIKLINRRWESQLIKNLSFVVIVMGIVFSGINFINQLALSEPTIKQMEALDYLSSKSSDYTTIFSSYERGYWFNHINKKNVMDPDFFYAPKINERWSDSMQLLNSGDLKTTLMLLNKYNIEYIWLDAAIRDKFYGKDEINLLYQLRNDPRFRMVYRNFDKEHRVEVEIYKYEKKVFIS
ncbi:MAG: hypothetical protein AABW41_04585 [Nanoarchaeota archaeon]